MTLSLAPLEIYMKTKLIDSTFEKILEKKERRDGPRSLSRVLDKVY